MEISEETVGEVHTHLPTHGQFPTSMSAVKRRGGPWRCESCGGPSYWIVRCTKCGSDLV